MNKQKAIVRSHEEVSLRFSSIRNISSPEDTQNNRKVYLSQSEVSSIADLPTNENVRNYLANAEGKQRKSYTTVHKAIKETLLNDAESFSILNSGITIVASEMVIDESKKIVTLTKASIINGSQTQGVIKDLLENEVDLDNIHIKCEIIVTTDEDLVAEISIARNFQNNVMLVSIAGRRGQFDEIEKSVQKRHPHLKLRKSESTIPSEENGIIDSEKLLQVITALIPPNLWDKDGMKENPNKVYTYSMKARCLKDFQSLYESAKDRTSHNHEESADLYKFFIEIAPDAYDLYASWKAHQGFKGTGLRSIEREGREIVDVPDGIIFPIIASLAVFAEKVAGKWKLNVPSSLIDLELIKTAKYSYQEIAASNPQTMGKNKACYSSLLQITNLYKKLTTNK